ncbi:MAG: phosphoglycerate kinase, partial [Thermodesulfobacteriota bacterium]
GFGEGTAALAAALSESDAWAGIVGESTLNAITEMGLGTGKSFISKGGEAALEFIRHKTLPAITALEKRIR